MCVHARITWRGRERKKSNRDRKKEERKEEGVGERERDLLYSS